MSTDGSMVISDPGVGISRFCGVCGTTCIIARTQTQENRDPDGPSGGDPVDLALGQMIVEKTDLVLPGRLPAVVHRTYNPFDPFGAIAGFELSLGPGWALSVEVVLLEVNVTLRRLVLPGNARFEFVQQPDGSFVNTTHPRFTGATLIPEGAGRHRLRFKDGTVWRFGPGPFAGLGLLVEQVDRNGNYLTIEHDSSGKITRLIEPARRPLTFTYTSGRLTEVRDPLGRTVHYSYNSARRLETVTDPAGGTTHYTYDGAGRIHTITDPRGITYLTNEYDASGRVFRQTQADGGVWTFQYLGPAGAPTGVIVTDPRGNATTQRFSPTGFASETVDALGQMTRIERDARGQVTATTDPLQRVTRFEFDGAGNVTHITDSVDNVRTFTYEPTFNRVTSITDPLGNVTAFEYDARGNLICLTDPEQNRKPDLERRKTCIDYNAFGQPIAITDPLNNVTHFEYDAVGNLASIIDPLGNTTRRTYDLVSRLIAQTNPRGRTTRFTHDELNRIRQIIDALNGVIAFSYDGNGNMLTVTDAKGQTTTYTYDLRDRLSSRTDPLGATETFEYDVACNLIRHTDRNGQGTVFSYDALNRRIGASYADGTTASFVYDSVGRLIQAADSVGGTILNDFDVLGRLVSQITDLGIVRYQYDAVGRRKQMEVTGQEPVIYAYDANSRLMQITQGIQVVDFTYDALGRRTRLGLPNGIATEYVYDAASQLTEMIYRNATGVIGNLIYQYDSAGNRIAVGGSFARTSLPPSTASATYNGANRQLQFGDKQMTFDANGNLTSITDASGNTAFTWDARNRLVALERPGNTARFTYDPARRRIAKEINGKLTRYIYDGPDILQEFSNGATVHYLRGLSIDEPFTRSGNEVYLADALGSIVAVTDSAGRLTTGYTYDAFGNTSATNPLSPNSFQYSGRENDGTGFYFYRARYYAPALQCFLSEDPSEFAGGDINLYTYVRNNPVLETDPLGLEPASERFCRGQYAACMQAANEVRKRAFEEARARFLRQSAALDVVRLLPVLQVVQVPGRVVGFARAVAFGAEFRATLEAGLSLGRAAQIVPGRLGAYARLGDYGVLPLVINAYNRDLEWALQVEGYSLDQCRRGFSRCKEFFSNDNIIFSPTESDLIREGTLTSTVQ